MQDLNKYKEKWFEFLDYTPHHGQKKLHYPTKKNSKVFCNDMWEAIREDDCIGYGSDILRLPAEQENMVSRSFV